MLKTFLHRTVRKLEREYDYDASYIHDVIETSPAAALKFTAVQLMSGHRKAVPKDAASAAGLAGALSEDCGPCVQLCVDMAAKAGVAPQKIAALIRGDIEAAGPDAALAFRYGIAVATNSDAILPLIEQVRARFGEHGLISLAYLVTSARMYPTLKRALGHGMACTRVTVSDQPIAVKHAA